MSAPYNHVNHERLPLYRCKYCILVKNYIPAFAARKQGKTRGAIVFSLNFLVTFSFKRKSDKQTLKGYTHNLLQIVPSYTFLCLITLCSCIKKKERIKKLRSLLCIVKPTNSLISYSTLSIRLPS